MSKTERHAAEKPQDDLVSAVGRCAQPPPVGPDSLKGIHLDSPIFAGPVRGGSASGASRGSGADSPIPPRYCFRRNPFGPPRTRWVHLATLESVQCSRTCRRNPVGTRSAATGLEGLDLVRGEQAGPRCLLDGTQKAASGCLIDPRRRRVEGGIAAPLLPGGLEQGLDPASKERVELLVRRRRVKRRRPYQEPANAQPFGHGNTPRHSLASRKGCRHRCTRREQRWHPRTIPSLRRQEPAS